MKVDDIESEHLRMLTKCLKMETKGKCYDMLADETKDWKDDDKLRIFYMMGVIHGADEGVYSREDTEAFLKNVAMYMKFLEIEKMVVSRKEKGETA
jgi:hypothetical protein